MEHWSDVRKTYSAEDWQNVEEHYEAILTDALRYLSRSPYSLTTHSILERKGFDMVIEDELMHRGYINLEVASGITPTRVYSIALDSIEGTLKTIAATAEGQMKLCLA